MEEKDVLIEGVQHISIIIRDLMGMIIQDEKDYFANKKEDEYVIQDTDSQS